jgi:hypothetical protein
MTREAAAAQATTAAGVEAPIVRLAMVGPRPFTPSDCHVRPVPWAVQVIGTFTGTFNTCIGRRDIATFVIDAASSSSSSWPRAARK